MAGRETVEPATSLAPDARVLALLARLRSEDVDVVVLAVEMWELSGPPEGATRE